MNDADFDIVLNGRMEKIKSVLSKKANEYARGDRLSNFKKAAATMSCTPEQACVSFWMKHVISITDLVKDLESGKTATAEMWDEKIGDAINYLVLLDALIDERLSK